MKKNKKITNKNENELAQSLGLSHLDALEWRVHFLITNKIIESAQSSNLTITEIAKLAGTSRARITKILKNDAFGISLDVLIRVLGALGEDMKIIFKKSA